MSKLVDCHKMNILNNSFFLVFVQWCLNCHVGLVLLEIFNDVWSFETSLMGSMQSSCPHGYIFILVNCLIAHLGHIPKQDPFFYAILTVNIHKEPWFDNAKGDDQTSFLTTSKKYLFIILTSAHSILIFKFYFDNGHGLYLNLLKFK